MKGKTRAMALVLVAIPLIASAWVARPQVPENVLWAVTFTPGPGWKENVRPDSQPYFGGHSRNLGRLRRDSVIVAGGRFGRFGLMILRGPTEAGIREHFAGDSTIVTRVFDVTVDRWYTVYGGTLTR